MATAPQLNPIARAHQDAQRAVATFLPSLVGRQEPPPPPPSHPEPSRLKGPAEATRVLSIANKGEMMSKRLARGMPPVEKQPTPEEQFGNNLDIVHTRALAAAIAAHPEEDRGRLISEAHDSAVKWIASHNGKVVVHGKVMVAHSPQSAEALAAKIVNDEVEGHDQREVDRKEAALQPAGSEPGERSKGSRGTAARGKSTPETPPTDTPPAQPSARTLPQSGPTPQASAAVPSPASSPPPLPSVQPSPDSSTAAPPNPIPQTPTIVPPGGDPNAPPLPPPPPAPPVTPQEAARVGTEKDDGHQITQPKKSVEQNQALAMEAAPQLHTTLISLASQVPGIKYERLRPQKDDDRLDQKVEDDNDPDTLSDYLGAQVAADSPAAKDRFIELLQKHFKTIEVDDQFMGGREDKAGYPSANVQVQLGNGATAEVQVVPKEVQDRTDASHKFYKAGREAEQNGDTKERDKQWEQAKAIHGEALAAFRQRNGISGSERVAGNAAPGAGPDASSSAGLPEGFSVAGKPIKIGNRTFIAISPQGSAPAGQGRPVPDIQGLSHGEATGDSAVRTDAQPSGPSASDGGGPSVATAHASADEKGGQITTPQDASVPLTKGQSVTLADGSPAKVTWIHPNLNIAKVRTEDGSIRVINPTKDLADAKA